MGNDGKLKLKDINFDVIETILNALYESKQNGGDEFDNIWSKTFVDKFSSDVCELSTNKDKKYENPIIEAIYLKCKDFYDKGCNEINNYIKTLESEMNSIWESDKKE